MKRDRLNLHGGMTVETGRDWDGRYFIAYRKGCSMYFRELKPLRKFLSLPIKTASRDALDSWLASLEAMDAERRAPEPVGDANVDGSFDPLAHEEDPALSTKMVI